MGLHLTMGCKRRCCLYTIRNILRNGIFLSVFLGFLLILCLHQGFFDLEFKSKRLHMQSFNTRMIHQVKRMNIHTNETENTTIIKADKVMRDELCNNLTGSPNNTTKITPIAIRWSRNNAVMYCPIYKVGTTFWRRVFMIQREREFRHLRNPFDIPFDKEYKSSVYGINDAYKRSNSFKFMFTRNPYTRLYSTYVDKLLAPNPHFWKLIGERVVRLTRPNLQKNSRICGDDVTFPEFIKYVIHALEHNNNIDPHFVPMETNCQSCKIKYDFIGKMEEFEDGSTFILHKLNLSRIVQLLAKDGRELAADDAIRDTLKQPFTFRQKYIRCMPFYEALNRAWTKLKLRGLIGNDKLGLDRVKDAGVAFTRVVELARASRARSSSSTRRQLKERAYQQQWDMVPLSDKFRLRSLYANDFSLFNYDDTPASLFPIPNE